MSTRMHDGWLRKMPQLRHQPTDKRIRATFGDDDVVVDSTRAVLVWEPRRVAPVYAVPPQDVRARLVPEGPVEPGGPDFLHPGIPFAVHSAAGESLSVSVGGQTRAGAAFRPADPDLAGYVLLDTSAFDRWYEEDEPVRSHPRDPYHGIEMRASSRHLML
jgi:hypothetical protein